tara:strand:- start:1364 stop:1975 length:612 start_codon:yes stop_codon:yes gene_type:complete
MATKTTTKKKSVFETLNAINVNEHTENKNGLTYLSWAWAWQVTKENYPTAIYTIYESAEGMFYHTDGKTAWVKTGVTIEDVEHIEYLPVMDYRNKSISMSNITSTDVNKTIQRSLTKAIARHGLGLYVYAGEDLPSKDDGKTTAPKKVEKKAVKKEDTPEEKFALAKEYIGNHGNKKEAVQMSLKWYGDIFTDAQKNELNALV